MSNKPTKYYLDENGNPQRIEDDAAWLKWLQETDRTIASDKVRDAKVETYFAGIDQCIERVELFESVITLPEGAHVTKRYSTKEEALEGHDQAVLALKAQDQTSAAINWGSDAAN